jgi:hypothetical protein
MHNPHIICLTLENIMKTMTIRLLAASLFALVLNSAQAYEAPKVTQTTPSVPKSGIFIGNSFFYYNNSMHGHLRNFLNAADPKLPFRGTSVTISGAGLDWHNVEAYFAPNAIGRYSFIANNEVRFNKNDKLFDIAIMMDCSQCPVHPQLKSVFTEYVKKHGDTIRKNGADPILFMSWAYADKPEMTETLADAYIKAGNENNMMVIPAGIAFANSIAGRKDIDLYVKDKRHPSLAGTYLAAAVTYASLFKKSPIDNSYTAGLDPEVAKYLQTVAWNTVKDFYKLP